MNTMTLHQFLLPVAAAALLTACGASSVNDLSSAHQQLAPASSTPAPQGSGTASAQDESAASAQSPAVQKAALSLLAVSDPNNAAYKVGPRDVLEVTVFKVPELSKVVQVSEAGTISYPLVGQVRAGGRTAREIEQDLTGSLGAKYLQHPQVSVFVKEYNSQRITVEGAVKKPGVYPIPGGLTLLQATATAGGFEPTADETILLIRQTDGKRYAGRYDVARIRDGSMTDPHLEAGDVLIASTSDLKEGMNTFLRLVPLATIVPLL